jgi:hypothetical protein
MVLTLNALNIQLLFANNDVENTADSLGLLASNSQIIIAAAQNKEVNDILKKSIQVMKMPYAEILDEEQP